MAQQELPFYRRLIDIQLGWGDVNSAGVDESDTRIGYTSLNNAVALDPAKQCAYAFVLQQSG